MSVGAIEVSIPGRVTRKGLVLPRGQVSFEEWQQAGVALRRLDDMRAWALGDWWHFGEWEYGSRYLAAAAVVGLDEKTLRNYGSVAGRFQMSRRRDNLSFSHHAAVAYLAPHEQDDWLDRAAANRWSYHQLKNELRAELAPAPPPSPATIEQLRFAVDVARVDRWRRAADRAGCEFDEWAAAALDRAAKEQR